jgi:hypothetical protein
MATSPSGRPMTPPHRARPRPLPPGLGDIQRWTSEPSALRRRALAAVTRQRSGHEGDHPAGYATIPAPPVAAHDHLLPASAAVAGVAPPQVLPREPDEEETGDRSPHSKPTRDHPPATPGACHWLAHWSNRIRTQLPQLRSRGAVQPHFARPSASSRTSPNAGCVALQNLHRDPERGSRSQETARSSGSDFSREEASAAGSERSA